VRRKTTQFAVAAINQTRQRARDLLRSDWSEPQQTGSVDGAVTAAAAELSWLLM